MGIIFFFLESDEVIETIKNFTQTMKYLATAEQTVLTSLKTSTSILQNYSTHKKDMKAALDVKLNALKTRNSKQATYDKENQKNPNSQQTLAARQELQREEANYKKQCLECQRKLKGLEYRRIKDIKSLLYDSSLYLLQQSCYNVERLSDEIKEINKLNARRQLSLIEKEIEAVTVDDDDQNNNAGGGNRMTAGLLFSCFLFYFFLFFLI